jgi:hypothetical protein
VDAHISRSLSTMYSPGWDRLKEIANSGRCGVGMIIVKHVWVWHTLLAIPWL